MKRQLICVNFLVLSISAVSGLSTSPLPNILSDVHAIASHQNLAIGIAQSIKINRFNKDTFIIECKDKTEKQICDSIMEQLDKRYCSAGIYALYLKAGAFSEFLQKLQEPDGDEEELSKEQVLKEFAITLA